MALDRSLSASAWRAVKFLQPTPLGPLLSRLFGRATPEDVGKRLYDTQIRLADVAVRADDADLVDKASAILKCQGVVVLTGLLDEQVVRGALGEADALTAQIEALDRSVTHGELGKADWQTDLAVLRNYGELARHPKPVINIRSRSLDVPDGGMVDIFKVEDMLTDEQPALRRLVEAVSNGAISAIMAKSSAWPMRQYNLYRNDSVTNTRVLHVDNLRHTHKVFCYLSDVETTDDGPYMFMAGTHARGGLLRKMLYVNSLRGTLVTNMPTTVGTPLTFLGKAGTVIISNQTGVHGGHPQKPGGSRTVLVGSYH